MFYYVAIGEVNLVDILAIVFFTSVVSPLVISVLLNSIRQLDASYAYLDSATKQEKLLNQTLKDNINRLNIEIDERKMAFHAKHRAIEELRREIAERKKNATRARTTRYVTALYCRLLTRFILLP
jgi:two-component system aerobic respiration control sensor histidine kinase ArcB